MEKLVFFRKCLGIEGKSLGLIIPDFGVSSEHSEHVNKNTAKRRDVLDCTSQRTERFPEALTFGGDVQPNTSRLEALCGQFKGRESLTTFVVE